jgi:putative FmdB family regulatory protein
MPIYEFRCRRCGRTTSLLVKSASATVRPTCEACGGRSLERTLSAFAYHMSQVQKTARLDPKYREQVDQAVARAPKDTDPAFHLRKMVPFSAVDGGRKTSRKVKGPR